MKLASYQSTEGNSEDTEPSLRAVLDLLPGHVEARVNLAQMLRQRGERDGARAQLKTLLDGETDEPRAYLGLAFCDLDEGKMQEAVVLLQRAAGRAGRDSGLRAAVASTLIQIGRVDEARKALEGAARSFPDDPMILNEVAWSLVDPVGSKAIHDAARALPLARRAVEITRRKDLAILDTLAVALFAHGELEEAVKVQTEIVSKLKEGGHSSGGIPLSEAEAALVRYREALDGAGR
ncbi:MAG: tetratricopeptide repeat protein [Planctomycetes bacterium]|nr:tetratricopeptide repeat protein [Planctomycetota bacterium]